MPEERATVAGFCTPWSIVCTHRSIINKHLNLNLKEGFAVPLSLIWGQFCHSYVSEALESLIWLYPCHQYTCIQGFVCSSHCLMLEWPYKVHILLPTWDVISEVKRVSNFVKVSLEKWESQAAGSITGQKQCYPLHQPKTSRSPNWCCHREQRPGQFPEVAGLEGSRPSHGN